jgi:hypothetical protein
MFGPGVSSSSSAATTNSDTSMRVLELPGFGGQRKVGENQAQSASEKQNGDST